MNEWTQADTDIKSSTESLTGYAVYDALGVRLGYVSGWVFDDSGQIQMLKVSITEWAEPTEYLVPIGAITLIDDAKSSVQLRDLMKDSIRRMCFQLTDGLPERRLLIRLIRHFPPPRASILERLCRLSTATKTQDGLRWTRLSEISQRS